MSQHTIVQSLELVVLGAAMWVMAKQCRKPDRWFGRVMVRIMNRTHGPMTAWGLRHITVEKGFTVLDVGCGGGRTIDRLASLAPNGHVSGIDYAAGSVATARATNAARIAEGRVDIQRGSVSALPFDADTFDIATAVETHYYWPDLPRDMREVQRVLKPGGTLLIVAEAYRGQRMDWLYRPALAVLGARYLTIAEHRALFVDAGYVDVVVETEPGKGWICAMGTKPRRPL